MISSLTTWYTGIGKLKRQYKTKKRNGSIEISTLSLGVPPKERKATYMAGSSCI